MKQNNVNLPKTNENGYYEMRLESIGGLGANLCGKLIGELGSTCLGLNVAVFSSYGSEKRGSPVRSYVRMSAGDREILHNSPVEHPHLLALFHRALARAGRVTAGVGEECVLVVNTPENPENTRHELRLFAGTVGCVDALKLALSTHSRVNMVMLGAIAKASGFITLEDLNAIVSETLGKKYPSMLPNNLAGIEAGFHNLRSRSFVSDGQYEVIPYRQTRSKWGYANAPIGGINRAFGSTVTNDLSPSREGYIPLFLPEKCIHCGLCDSTCPDMVFQFLPGEYKGKPAMLNRGIDYRHCKGCLRCVEICPTEALVMGKEDEHDNKPFDLSNKDLIDKAIGYEPTGADAYITGEAYLDEKRIDGGLM